MKKVDTIIVGMGIAGICYAETLQQKQKSFYIIDNNKNGSSKIAAGIYNPTVLKRYNMSWNGKKFHKIKEPKNNNNDAKRISLY